MISKNILTHEQAVNEFAHFLDLFDVDIVLEQAGLDRSDLKKLTYDDEIMQCITMRRDALLSETRRFSGDDGFIEGQISKWIDGIISASFNAELYGYSVIENIFNKDLTLKKSIEKPFNWFIPTPEGDLYYSNQNDTKSTVSSHTLSTGETITGIKVNSSIKFIASYNHATYEEPSGVALMSRLYWPWFFRQQGWPFWVQFLERFGNPYLVGESNNTEDMAMKLQNAVQDSTIAVPIGDKVSALETNNTGESFKVFETVIVRRIQKLLLGRVLTGDLDIGSRAAQEVEVKSTTNVKHAAAMRRAERMVQSVCDAISIVNARKKIVFNLGESKQLHSARADRDRTLSSMDGFSLTRSYIEREYGLKPDDFKLD